MYFTVLLSTDATYREEFADDVGPAVAPSSGRALRLPSGATGGGDRRDRSDGSTSACSTTPPSCAAWSRCSTRSGARSTPLVGVELLRAIEHAGGYVAAAYARRARSSAARSASSAATSASRRCTATSPAILPGVRRTGLGRAMKLHQRAWAADHGLAWVTWTFDPLVRRNAWFNLDVLGAEVHEYLVDFYGPIDDAINAGDESDRLLVAWAVDDDGPTDGAAPAAPTGTRRRADARGHRRAAAHRPGRGRRRGATGCAPSSADALAAGGARRRLHPRRRVPRAVDGHRDGTIARAAGDPPAARHAVPDQLRRADEPAHPARAGRGRRRRRASRGLGRVRRRRRADVLVGVRRRRRARDRATCSCPRLAARRRPRRGRRRPACSSRSAATRWPRRRSRWPCSTPSCAPPGRSFADLLGVTRDAHPERRQRRHPRRRSTTLLAAVAGYLDDGYVRIKLKIEPGWDLEPVAAVRDLIGPDVPLQVDANAAYTRDDVEHLARLDEFDLLLIEQPLAEDDLLGHAELARGDRHAGVPRRVDHVADGRRRRHRARRAPRSSTSSPAGSAAT